jgi:acetylornithine deacetylase/succinyl-diaminopimelate desuccinylase-like protein
LGKAQPVKIDYKSGAVQAAAHAYAQAFAAEPLFLRGGGSLPIVHQMVHSLSSGSLPLPVVMIGFGLPDDGTHAPNEKFYLPNFYRGIETAIHFYDRFASL